MLRVYINKMLQIFSLPSLSSLHLFPQAKTKTKQYEIRKLLTFLSENISEKHQKSNSTHGKYSLGFLPHMSCKKMWYKEKNIKCMPM